MIGPDIIGDPALRVALGTSGKLEVLERRSQPVQHADGTPEASVSFGPFRLFPRARSIERDGVRMALGSRALDILIVLVEHAGELVSHKELTSRVWRELVVSASNLRVHVTGLRKALGEGEGQSRYIANVPGQGYCFVAPVDRGRDAECPEPGFASIVDADRRRIVLPPVLARMVGRDDEVRAIASGLVQNRFLTIVGPGGMGKTTVAVAVAHLLVDKFAEDVCFVDLGAITDPLLVVTTVASTLGLAAQTEDALPGLMEFLRHAHMMLVLDNCDHVIDAAAMLAEQIFGEATRVHILATSREALRAEGEHASQLSPLPSPAPECNLPIAELMAFPAVQLFVERAAASGTRFQMSAADGPLVADICSRLDGIALAIEFAAGRVGSYGVKATARLLANHLGLHWQGRRTAPPRHQTLHALLDWSYHLLPAAEQTMLRRLSVFVGPFTLEAAKALLAPRVPHETDAVDDLGHLVAKSLVSVTHGDDSTMRYRLLETTRVFASGKLNESGELDAMARRHARYFTDVIISSGAANSESSLDGAAHALNEHLGNIRAALGWCFGNRAPYLVEGELREALAGTPREPRGAALARDAVLGVELAATVVPAMLELSLLGECHKWSESALLSMDEMTRGGTSEMTLQEARATASMWTRGKSEEVRGATARALEIARGLDDNSHYLRLLVATHLDLVRNGDGRGSLAIAEELAVCSQTPDYGSYRALSEWLRGTSHHFLGNQEAAHRHFKHGFARGVPLNLELFGLNCRVRALVAFARALWARGFADQAVASVNEAVASARSLSNPLNLCFTLAYATPVFLWCGEWGIALKMIEELTEHPNWHSLPSFHAIGLALKGELLIRTGHTVQGTALLSPALQTMRADRDDLMLGYTSCALGECLSAIGRLDEARAVIEDAIVDLEGGGMRAAMPELLRIQANVLRSMAQADEEKAEVRLMQAVACAREQGALGWELRATMALASLLARLGRRDEGRLLLVAVYERFTEGFETRDLKLAQSLLDDLGASASLQPQVFQ